ncbi:putative zinc-binding metallopeptidase [Asticcacaulis sp. BYS171W]|uniref:Zinc-binding metallopeptidase n=1 Tax=Asticcacaulis aquaticus TaxID=2984212 RepID=A0ABT5HXT5_9CAUL|nr:putative zinc-binding metallopeptidase [Asticcacaulis aquaticus]MDC7684885.1 putative zinc-binding metallopeptidase [Asticcacaulis aquaticus]
MKIFHCGNCGNTTFFHNRNCVNCGYRLGFSPLSLELRAVDPIGTDTTGKALWRPTGRERTYRFCENAKTDVCNWLVADGDDSVFCRACRHNRLIPNDLDTFRRISEAERHLFYAFLKWDLPAPDRKADPEGGMVFDYLEDSHLPDGSCQQAMTGHDEGVISIRAAEADDAVRETVRAQMGEPYRTLLGHFRHESGHFIWNKLVRDAGLIDQCRAVFGDESVDYDQAIARHYSEGPPRFWADTYISTYASMHPWEDFAETFAHVLHITDALETAHCYGMALKAPNPELLTAEVDFDPYGITDFEKLADVWVPLSLAINSIHSAMGERPLYPFILSPRVREKMGFVHKLITRQPV